MTTNADADETGHHDHPIPAGIPVGHDHWIHFPNRKTVWGKITLMPVYGWLLLLYVIGALILQDPRYVLEMDLPLIGIWKISWITFVLGLSPILVAFELAHLSKPGVNQMDEIMWITICLLVQVTLVAIAYSSAHLAIFRTSEMMLLVVGNAVQLWAAYWVNSNSLIRTIAPGPVTGN